MFFRRFWRGLALSLFFPATVCGQEIVNLRAQIPALVAQAPAPQVSAPASLTETAIEIAKPKALDKKFWALGIALNTAMVLDARSTFATFERCNCVESNPYARPLYNNGKAVTYLGLATFEAGLMFLAAKMRTTSKKKLRPIWWLFPVLMTVGHTQAYLHNEKVGR